MDKRSISSSKNLEKARAAKAQKKDTIMYLDDDLPVDEKNIEKPIPDKVVVNTNIPDMLVLEKKQKKIEKYKEKNNHILEKLDEISNFIFSNKKTQNESAPKRRFIKTDNNCEDFIKPLNSGSKNKLPVLGDDLFSLNSANIFICAPKKSGKTSVINKILEECADIDTKVFIFCATAYKDDNWITIIERLNKKNISNIVFTSIFDDENKNRLKTLINRLKDEDEEDEDIKKKYEYPEYIIIFDDLSNELKNKMIPQLMKIHRHFRMKVIISSQNWKDTHSDIRKGNLDYILLFRNIPEDVLETIYDENPSYIGYKKWITAYKYSTKEPFNFFFYDRNDIKLDIHILKMPPKRTRRTQQGDGFLDWIKKGNQWLKDKKFIDCLYHYKRIKILNECLGVELIRVLLILFDLLFNSCNYLNNMFSNTNFDHKFGICAMGSYKMSEKYHPYSSSDKEIKKRSNKYNSSIYEHFFKFIDSNDKNLIKMKCKYCQVFTFKYDKVDKKSVSSGLGWAHLENVRLSCHKESEIDWSYVAEQKRKKAETLALAISKPFSQGVSEELLIDLVIKKNLPFNLTEDERFKNFISSLRPEFNLVGGDTIKNRIIKRYDDQVVQLREYFKTMDSKISFCFDIWSVKDISFLGVTGHWIDSQFKARKCLLGMESLKSDKTEKFDISKKIMCTTSDNCSNNHTTVENIVKNQDPSNDYKGFQGGHILCLNHVINLGDKSTKYLFDKIHSYGSNLRNSSNQTDAFFGIFEILKTEKKDRLKPKVLNPIRWSSAFQMTSRFIRIKDAVDYDIKYKITKHDIHLTTDEWDIIKQINKFLDGVDFITLALQGADVNLSCSLPVYGRLLDIGEEWKTNKILKTAAEAFWKEID
ncbi:hypothetical protein PPL_12646, partial [Heterostelium album PN500]